MKKQIRYSKHEKGQFETEVMGNNTMGAKTIIKTQQSRALGYVNLQPEATCCEICGRKTDDLQPFDEEFCELFDMYERSIEDLYLNIPYILKYITTDHKLAKNFRSFYQEPANASWECKNCISLSTEEAIKYILEHN